MTTVERARARDLNARWSMRERNARLCT